MVADTAGGGGVAKGGAQGAGALRHVPTRLDHRDARLTYRRTGYGAYIQTAADSQSISCAASIYPQRLGGGLIMVDEPQYELPLIAPEAAGEIIQPCLSG